MKLLKLCLFSAIAVVALLFASTTQAETSSGWEKDAANPVLGGKFGTCTDIALIREGDTFKMWFSWRPKNSIGYTESKDGIHWSDPKVVLSPAGGWEGILNRIGVVFKDGKYHMWYTGQLNVNGNYKGRIGYATSTDGVNWTRVQKDPVFSPQAPWEKDSVMCPCVMWDETNKVFKMWYSAGEWFEPNAIGYATSTDGINWNRYSQEPIFAPDKNINWEHHKVGACHVLKHNDWYYIFYIGYENEHLARIGIARSKDGITNWERLKTNPIIGPDAGKWDASACYKPFAIYDKEADLWRLWYNGRNGGMEQIGLVIHKGEDLGFDAQPAVLSNVAGEASVLQRSGWEKYSANPVLGGKFGTCFDISVLREGDTFKMWFSWRPKASVGYTESKDGIHWSDPKVVLSPAGGWEGILNRIGVVFKDGKYHMWYTGQLNVNGNYKGRIGYATSTDGVNWTRVQKDPVFSPQAPWEKDSVMCPCVMWDETEKVFKMWYSAGEWFEPNAIGYATSTDGINWNRYSQEPVFGPDKNIFWEHHKVGACHVLKHNDWYYIFYIGYENEHLARIGIARSKDGITNWERLKTNPIIGPDKGKWDECACYKPHAIYDKENDLWRLWYNGRDNHLEQIGLVIHKGEDLGFDAQGQTSSETQPAVLKMDDYKRYIDQFNADDEETAKNAYPNEKAWEFLRANMPLLDYPDKDLERTWYFRWWTVRKCIRSTPDGFVVLEFLPNVGWAKKHNTISCAAGHHFRELRWIKDRRVLNDYAVFWLRKGGPIRGYTFWAADSIWQYTLETGDTRLAIDLLPELINNFEAWKKDKLDPNGLFWQIDGYDGMEVSVGGHGYRATINSYMYMEALAIARIAKLAGKADIEKTYADQAAKIRNLLNSKLWDKDAQFYKVAPRVKTADEPLKLQDVREEHGFTPWYADNASIPPTEYTVAWNQLLDPKGFYAPFGPTTTEQRHPGFKISYEGHECQWNGPSWPFSTAVTLTALANLLNRDATTDKLNADLQTAFLKTLDCYVRSHNRVREDGKKVPWIDENINPMTGDWIARTRLKDWGWQPGKGGYERGKDYNHSTFCDIVINSLIGIRPSLENGFNLFPLVDRSIPYFCLDNVVYHDHLVTILYDSTGERYNKGKGLHVYADGKEIYSADNLPEKPVWVEFK